MADYRTDPVKRRGELKRLERNRDHALRAARKARARGWMKRAATYLEDANYFHARWKQLGGRPA